LQDVGQAGVHHGGEKMRAVGFKATFQDDALVGRMPAAAHTPTSAVINEMELLRASRAMATAPSTPACSPSAETTTLGGYGTNVSTMRRTGSSSSRSGARSTPPPR